ncbi:TPA: hypothetical protein ACSTJZ_003149 [Serratia fonticola]|uniref:hypothetical protein n=1 Tax=Serratia fonticola TaxID=47917 RepID=UPI0034C69006
MVVNNDGVFVSKVTRDVAEVIVDGSPMAFVIFTEGTHRVSVRLSGGYDLGGYVNADAAYAAILELKAKIDHFENVAKLETI